MVAMPDYLLAPLIVKRRALGLSPTSAAQKARLHPDTVLRIESGKACHPASVKKYAESLGVAMEEIVAIPDL
jgi:DNA-binding XRE family transcriptional regulator